MFSNLDIQELLEVQSPGPFLSVYIHNNAVENTIEANKLKLRSMLEEVPQQGEAAAAAVRAFFESEFDWQQDRSGVVFSDQSADFFKSYILPIIVPDRIRYSQQLLLRTLVSLHQATSGYGVALVDQQQARLMVFQMGELVAEDVHEGEDIHRIKHGGGSQTTGRRRGDEGEGEKVDMVKGRNLRDAAERANQFFGSHDVERIFLGGTETNTAAFSEQLGNPWQNKVSGVIPLGINANPQQVQTRVLEIGAELDRQRKDELVELVITEAAKGRHGVLRTEDILGAVREGRVQTLLLDEKFQQPGYRCVGCEYLTVQELDRCPFCGQAFEVIDDAGEMAVKQVLLSGGDVEVVEGHTTLQDHGGIAALLRY